jgi:hypothetical protein
MSIPKEPRQQMINLMYLFLTAMLALNVSKQVLDAFVKVDKGIQSTISAIESKNQLTFDQFRNQMEINEDKTKPYYDKAVSARDHAEELYEYIGSLRDEIINKAGGLDKDSVVMEKMNTDDRSQGMNFEGERRALEKKNNKRKDSRMEVIGKVDKNAQDRFKKRLSLKKAIDPPDDPDNRSWAEYNFQMVPTVASLALLTKLQNDVKSAEADVTNYLLNQIGAEDIKVDVLQARVIENTNYVMSGQDYRADIFVSAYSSTQEPEVFIGELDTALIPRDTTGNYQKLTDKDIDNYANKDRLVEGKGTLSPLTSIDTILPPQGGMGKFHLKPTNVGINEYQGAIRIRKPTGEYEWYPFQEDYQVAEGAVVVSPDKMNVMYIGVDNPLSISVPGFKPEDVSATISQGSLSPKGKGKYIGRVVSPGKARVSVSVEMGEEGEKKTRTMGAKEFRVKRVPDPVATVGGKFKGGTVNAGTFKAQGGVIAVLENFEFDLRFDVVEFSMTYIPQRADALTSTTKGARWGSRMQKFLNRAKPGDRFFIDNIKVRGPSGNTRSLPSISFELT